MRYCFTPVAQCAIALVFLLAISAKATTFHVDASRAEANDNSPGSAAQPFKTISRAAERVEAGDVVQIHSGVYRERVKIKHSGTQEQPIRFERAPTAQVVITGADLLTGWRKEAGSNNLFSTAWPWRIVPADDHLPGGVQQVFMNQQLLREVFSQNEVVNGTFFIDGSSKRVFVSAAHNPDEPSDLVVEGSGRAVIWEVSGSYVQTRGLSFRCAANRGQEGMARFHGPNAVVEDCVFEWSNSTGANFIADDMVIRRCIFQDNGQQGFSGSHSNRLRLDGCTIRRNNVKEFPRGWEAGGDKMCLSRDVIYENCRFLNNHGNGVWFDISNQNATVRNCLVADNEDAGIFYEISYGLHAHDNVIVGNGCRPSKGSWGANGGICISSSPECVIERNLIVGNYQGFCFREQNRTTPRRDGTEGAEVPVWVHDEVVRNNLIAGNINAQVQGWFDVASERFWPRALQTGHAEGGKASEDVAAGYQADKDAVPPGLDLQGLKITFQGNCYAKEPSQAFFIWGTNWKRKQAFKDIASLTQTLGLEDQHSRMIPSLPVDAARRDFRLPRENLAIGAGAYPQGGVPDCTLGVR